MPLSAQRFAGNVTLNSCVDAGYRIEAGEADQTAVSIIQTALRDLGYRCVEDGTFGADTGAWVVAFKTDEGLTPNDAVVGIHTMQHLDGLYDWEPADPDAPDPSVAGLDALGRGAMDLALTWIEAALESLTRWPPTELHPEDPVWQERELLLYRHLGIHPDMPPDDRATVIAHGAVPIFRAASRALAVAAPFILVDVADRTTIAVDKPYVPIMMMPGSVLKLMPPFRNVWSDIDRSGAVLRWAVQVSSDFGVLAWPTSVRYVKLSPSDQWSNAVGYVSLAFEIATGDPAPFRPLPRWL